MTIRDLKMGDLFVVATSNGRSNAQVFKVKGEPYYNQYAGCDLINVSNMRKGTQCQKYADVEVIKVDSWLNPFPKSTTT